MKQESAGVFFGKWLVTTTLGWFIGFVLLILLAEAWSGLTGTESQFMVGVGMGTGVGVLQMLAISNRIESPRRWPRASTIGMGAPFVLGDITRVLGLNFYLGLPVCVLLGGLLVGALQAPLLRPRYERVGWWPLACVFGWGLPVLVIIAGDNQLLPKWLSVAAMLLGGVILGSVTGVTFHLMARASKSQ